MENLTLKERWKANSPKRNKTLTNICVGIVSVAGVIVSLPLLGLAVPATLLTYATVAVTVGGALGVKSKLTVEDTKDE
jgi:hypothetical protein